MLLFHLVILFLEAFILIMDHLPGFFTLFRLETSMIFSVVFLDDKLLQEHQLFILFVNMLVSIFQLDVKFLKLLLEPLGVLFCFFKQIMIG